MSEDDHSELIAIEDSTRNFVESDKRKNGSNYKKKDHQFEDESEFKNEKKRTSLLRRIQSFSSARRSDKNEDDEVNNVKKNTSFLRRLPSFQSARRDETEENEVRNETKKPSLLKRLSSFQSARKSDKKEEDEVKSETKKPSLLRRLPSFQSALSPNVSRLRRNFRSLSCVESAEDDEMPMTVVPRHRSIDINVGLARKMSTFLFTRKTVCMHPYHPYTPEQTTRKLYFGLDEK